MPWAALGGLGLGLGLDFMNGMLGHYRSKDLMSRQNDYNLYMFNNRYQMQTADMRKAGLNPILSAGGSVGTPAGVGIASSPGGLGSHSKQLERIVDRMGEMYDAQLDKAQAEAKGAEAEALKKQIDTLILTDAGETPMGGSSAKQQENAPKISYGPDGEEILEVNVPTNSKPPPLWKVKAQAERRLLQEGVKGKELDNALKDVERRYKERLQYERDKQPILPTLEAWGSSVKQVASAMKDVGLNLNDLVRTILEIKKLKAGNKDRDRRYDLDREKFEHKEEMDWLNFFAN